MNQPVTNEACENRRCEIRKLVQDEVSKVLGTVSQNHASTNDWIVRVEQKIDLSNERISDKIDRINYMQVVLILAVALGAIGLRMEWI